MEGAIRSGRIAAMAACRHLGLTVPVIVHDLPKNPLVRLITAPSDAGHNRS
jgi:hypothetical protein